MLNGQNTSVTTQVETHTPRRRPMLRLISSTITLLLYRCWYPELSVVAFRTIVGVAVTRKYVGGVVDTVIICAMRRKLLNSAGALRRHLNAPNYQMETVTTLA